MPDDTDPVSNLDGAYDDGETAPQQGVTGCSGITWFRMRLVDEEGMAMENEDYVVVDSAGASWQGKLDENGEFYIPPSIPIGQCQVQFPNIHLNPKKRKS